MNFYGFVTSSRHCGQDLRSCPTCGKEAFHTLERRKDWFTLFFLPIIPLSRGLGVTRCNLCGQESIEGGGHAAMSHVQAGTKTCPDCAELIKLEARICRYCRYRFSDEETAAAKQHAEATAAEIAAGLLRQRRLRRARVLSVLGWLLAVPGTLWSILWAFIVIQNRSRSHVLVWTLVWLIMSTPLWLGLFFRRRARKIRKSLESPPAETEDDVWGEKQNWAENPTGR